MTVQDKQVSDQASRTTEGYWRSKKNVGLSSGIASPYVFGIPGQTVPSGSLVLVVKILQQKSKSLISPSSFVWQNTGI